MTEASVVYKPSNERPWKRVVGLRRLILTSLVLLQTAFAATMLKDLLPYRGEDGLEIAIIVVFAILFCWISIGFWLGIFGFMLRLRGGDPHSLMGASSEAQRQQVPFARTAVLMPIYNEPVDRSLGGLASVYKSIEATGALEHFDFYILSDSRDPEVWLAEQAAWYDLTQSLNAGGKLFYRRRPLNQNYKSGNVADFFRRWGKNYRYAVVLDADSLMAGDTLTTMVQLMQLNPKVGILQTAPSLINAQSVFAKAQQFANRLYGPIFTSGLAGLQLGEAVFWGHNAIIRVDAFMKHCGLKKLRGFGLFKGPITSHDFVEAAYMGRAGYEVWLEPELTHSYEESPPSLVDELTRDKRWAKGNLQHIWIMLGARRLKLAHRLAFLNGIMSYVTSPIWFIFLVLTTVAAARLYLLPIDYFPEAYSPYPLWPRWEPDQAMWLLALIACLLFAPKLLALLDAVVQGEIRRFGGLRSAFKSLLGEIMLSMLLAPVRMLSHTRSVLEGLFNLKLSWAGQNRSDELRWRDAIVNQAPGSILAIAWAGFAYWLDTAFFWWSLPVAVPLILAAPTSVLSSRVRLGRFVHRHGFFHTPEEADRDELRRILPKVTPSKLRPVRGGRFVQAIIDPEINHVHRLLGHHHGGGIKATVLATLRRRCLLHGAEAMTRSEVTSLLQDRESMLWLHEQVWRSSPDSAWSPYLVHRSDARGTLGASN
ncbi:glucans biosynthesis glucosyltransferase MdoH [Allohahella sp. A8]|uniref:glucans biosynthesis glucosyltransferase MdoH n=1 Tax=Allohahella sp. A8 TaxID=3141461 RepID=UPI003A809C9C